MTLHDRDGVREQYKDSSNFGARVALHARFSTNPYRWTTWVFDQLALHAGDRVLEVGCGPGLLWLGKKVPDGALVVISDLSVGMVKEASSVLSFPALAADAQALAFPDESFDVVVANHMLYHVPDLDAALSEFARVLRPGGRFFATTNGQAQFQEIRAVLKTQFSYIDVFGLENGPPRIARHFDDVTTERHDDTIEATEVEPVLAYVRSTTSFRRIRPEAERELAEVVRSEIDRRGSFHITKDAGVIRGTKPPIVPQ